MKRHAVIFRRPLFTYVVVALLLAAQGTASAASPEKSLAAANSTATESNRTEREGHDDRRNAGAQSPAELAYAVEDRLLRDAIVSADDITVANTNGVIALSGQVASLLARERAARITETVRGVRSVDNRLTIRAPKAN